MLVLITLLEAVASVDMVEVPLCIKVTQTNQKTSSHRKSRGKNNRVWCWKIKTIITSDDNRLDIVQHCHIEFMQSEEPSNYYCFRSKFSEQENNIINKEMEKNITNESY